MLQNIEEGLVLIEHNRFLLCVTLKWYKIIAIIHQKNEREALNESFTVANRLEDMKVGF